MSRRSDWPPEAVIREVIEVKFRRGEGADATDPVRIVTAYYDRDGGLLAESDPYRPRGTKDPTKYLAGIAFEPKP